ncbi:phage terminase large subunit [Henriciella sp.]|uniref:phage terminase large subunit n=1 Tax=Henriciella sp. TaxID=1968823 RepID=UPI002631360A|nr:phage terminase large subunit [Henriciella sp.]
MTIEPSPLIIFRQSLPLFIAKAFTIVRPDREYAWNWHIDALSAELESVTAGQTRRLAINMPPRALKSLSISVAWVAFILGHRPETETMVVSYGEDIAGQLARDAKTLMESDFYRRLFPNTRLRSSKTFDLTTTRGGGRYTTTNGGVITGRGADLIILDDPQKPEDAKSANKREATKSWYASTLSTRLNDPQTGAIVLVQQRLHQDDLSGHLLQSGGWRHLCFPARATQTQEISVGFGQTRTWSEGELLHPDRLSEDVLAEQRRQMGAWDFEAQYQQQPVLETGNLLKPSWFQRYAKAPKPGPRARIVQSWDLAFGADGDYCACVTALVDGPSVWVLDVFRKKMLFPDQVRSIVSQARQYDAKDILVEKAANGEAALAQLRENWVMGVPSPIAIKATSGKVERATAASYRMEAGDVFLPERAPWMDEFLQEVAGFPNGSYLDQVDALVQLLLWTGERDTGGIVGPEEILPWA